MKKTFRFIDAATRALRYAFVAVAFFQMWGAGEGMTAGAQNMKPQNVDQPAQTSAEQNVRFHVDEGYTELQGGNIKAAIAAFERALEVDPSHRRARLGLGTALISAREYARARDILEVLAREFPEDYTVKNNLGWLYATAADLKVRDGKKALAYAQEALLMAPHDYHVWSTLAEAYYITEKYEQALRAAEESLRLVRLATQSAEVRQEYERQVEKCRLAVQALSILE